MNLIIEMVLKIFQAIFEEDTARRQAPKGQRPEGPPRPPKQGDHGEQDPQSVLAEFFRELQGLENPPPPPPKKQRRPPGPGGRSTPAAPHQRHAGYPPPVPRTNRREESLEEHIRRQEAHIRALEARAAQMSTHVKDHLGVEEGHPDHSPETPRLKRLPGSTPLEQMIYAGVILGPCKAKQPRGRLL